MNIVCIIGSLREKSFNRALFNTLVEVAPEGVAVREAPIGGLPLYNADNENPLPDSVQTFKKAIENADGVIIITPEYNRSISGVLKNAIDWASRPDGGSSWAGKAVTTMGATPGSLGTAAAQMHLKGILVYLGTRPMGQPEFYFGKAHEYLDDAGGAISDEKMRERVKKFLTAFVTHIGA